MSWACRKPLSHATKIVVCKSALRISVLRWQTATYFFPKTSPKRFPAMGGVVHYVFRRTLLNNETSKHQNSLIRPKTIFNLKSNLCWLVLNVWWGQTWCFGASFCYFDVWLFCCLVMPFSEGIFLQFLALKKVT